MKSASETPRVVQGLLIVIGIAAALGAVALEIVSLYQTKTTTVTKSGTTTKTVVSATAPSDTLVTTLFAEKVRAEPTLVDSTKLWKIVDESLKEVGVQ